VPDRAALLHPAVAPGAEHTAVLVHQRGADRDPAFGQPGARLGDRVGEQLVVGHVVSVREG